MMKKLRIFISVILSVFLMVGALTIFSGCKKKDGPNDFTFFISKHDGLGTYYDDYEDSMVVQWLNNQKWDSATKSRSVDGKTGDKLNFKFITPIPGAEQEMLNTMFISGEYADVIDLQHSTSSPRQLVKDGILMDLTEYVEEYMPNYVNYLNANPRVKSLVTEKDENGNVRYYSIYQLLDAEVNWPFQGFSYRRDWVVKYATPSTHVWDLDSAYVKANGHPEVTPLSAAVSAGNMTGWKANPVTTSFTSSYGADPNTTYTDNVIFPSGTEDPLYISDWEWMFDAFKKALTAKGLTADKDAYCMTVSAGGYAATGDLMSSFGGGSPNWYYDKDRKAQFGGTSDNFKVYLDCINNWHNQGWLDTKFEQRGGQMFYQINREGFTSGKVGMWQGNIAYLGANTAPTTGDSETMVFACPQPINDVYGDPENKFVVPNVFYQQGSISGRYGVTINAKNKNLEALFSHMNWAYGEEGGLVLGYGLNEEQYKSMTFRNDLFAQKGITTSYIRTDNADGTFTFTRGDIAQDSDYCNALTGFRLPFMNFVEQEVKAHKPVVMAQLNKWMIYTATGQTVDYTALMTPDESDIYAATNNYITTYMAKNLPALIKAKAGISSSAWSTYCTGLNKLAPEDVSAIYQSIWDRIQ